LSRPVDTLAKENAVAERLEKDREQIKERVTHSMSRTSSRTASHRGVERTAEPSSHTPTSPSSPKADSPKPAVSNAPSVRPSFSFANAAAGKKDATEASDRDTEVEEVAEKIADLDVA
jgi:translation initiation factor 4B